MNLVLAAHSIAGLAGILGFIIVIGCLVAAGFAAYRAAWIAVGCLLLVALIAGYLLL